MARGARKDRGALMAAAGDAFSRLQASTDAVDEAAGAALALGRTELFCLDLLFRRGRMSVDALRRESGLPPETLRRALSRLQLAGYTHQVPGSGRGGAAEIEPTLHAKAWVETIWGPLRDEGIAWLSGRSERELEIALRFIEEAIEIQRRNAERIRALAEAPASRRPTSNRPRGVLSPAALQRVILYARAHLEEPLPLSELAARAGLSQTHFARAFHATTGETPRRFVEKLRLEKAEQLLRESDAPISDVALACGFSSQSRLTTAFRRAMGVTPARFRRSGAAPLD